MSDTEKINFISYEVDSYPSFTSSFDMKINFLFFHLLLLCSSCLNYPVGIEYFYFGGRSFQWKGLN